MGAANRTSTELTLVESKLNQFKSLRKGWFCGDGVPIAEHVTDYVRKLDRGVILKTDVYAKLNGGLGYEIKGNKHDLELLICPDNTFDYLKFDKDCNCVDEGDELPWNQVLNVVQRFVKEERTSSEQYQLASSFLAKTDLTQDASTAHLTGRESLSLTKIAPLRKAGQFAGTLSFTIPA